MKKIVSLWFIFSSILVLSSSAQAGPINLVLVPGFFSSAIPSPSVHGNPWKQPYFSQDIVKYLTTKSPKIWVADNLTPTAGIEINGELLIRFLESHKADFGTDPIVLLGHSAGGLYSLYAAGHSDFPIQQVIAIGTPFKGVELLDILEDEGIPLSEIAKPFCLDNLMGLKAEPVRRFLQELNLKHPVRVDVFAGQQKSGLFVWDWKVLSPPLATLQAVLGLPSDGIVSVHSALTTDDLTNRKLANLKMQVHPEVILPLEHWEMVLDASLTRLFGVQNTGSLRRAQQKAYADIMRLSGY